MNAHTPGPWFCGRALRGGQECIVGDGDSVVCFMPDRTIGCTFIPANARLIAAAPELLEALQDIAADKCGCGHPHCNRCARDRDLAALIAKATGGDV